MTIDELSEEFITGYINARLRDSTARGYITNLKLHALPIIGQVHLDRLSVGALVHMTEQLQDKGLSNRTIIYVHATVRKMLNFAKKRGYVKENIYFSFDMPRIQEFAYKTLSEDDFYRMLALCSEPQPLHRAIRLALRYGMRRGEILGICPSEDLDERLRRLHIQRSRSVEHGQTVISPCKTKHSNRYILLTVPDTEDLKGIIGFAVPLAPTQLDRWFKRFLEENSFPNMRFHDLRHSYATLMLSKGVNPKIVSSVLGHSGVDITLDIYSHPDVRMQAACLRALEE